MGEVKNISVYAYSLKGYIEELGKITASDVSDMEGRMMVAVLCDNILATLDCEYFKFSRRMKLWVENTKLLCMLLNDGETIKIGLPVITLMSYVHMLIGHMEEILDLFISHYGIENK